MTKIAALPARGVIAVTGEDRVGFLQGLVSNDVAAAEPGRAVWAALLTPQGKWLADFFILSDGERLLLDCERAHLPMLQQRLTRYRLRSRVALNDADLSVFAAWDGEPDVGGIAARDPRLPEAGWRGACQQPAELRPTPQRTTGIVTVSVSACRTDRAIWSFRKKSILLEAGFDELNGVSWSKGCYMGQELTARTKYRGLAEAPPRTCAHRWGDTPAGRTLIARWSRGWHHALCKRPARGMAVVRLEALDSAFDQRRVNRDSVRARLDRVEWRRDLTCSVAPEDR